MAVQSSYAENIAAAVAGMIGNMVPSTLISRTVETAAGIGFGKAVAQGAADKGCIAFAGSGLLGITVRERSLDANDPDKFAEGDSARILVKGSVWVDAAVAVDAGDPVYVTSAGAFTKASSGNTLLPNARWETSTSEAALALLAIY